jgi:hypothetical protein
LDFYFISEQYDVNLYNESSKLLQYTIMIKAITTNL